MKTLKVIACINLALNLSACLGPAQVKSSSSSGSASSSNVQSGGAGPSGAVESQALSSAGSFYAGDSATELSSSSLPQGEVFGDFLADEQGFGRWTAMNSKVSTGLLCRNGTIDAVRSCNNPSNPSACIGPIRRVASCSEFNIEKEKFSAWGPWVPSGSCSNGNQNYSRTCFALDGQAPLCYGPSTTSLPCGSAPAVSKFTKMGECVAPPSSYNFDQYYIGCGGRVVVKNGVRTNQECSINAQGQLNCDGAAPQTEYCVRPGTTCTNNAAVTSANYVAGTYFTTSDGFKCGMPITAPITDANRFSAWSVTSQPELADLTLACASANHVVKARTCKRNTAISDCVLDIADVIAGKQNDSSCDGAITKEISSCAYSSVNSSYLTQLRRNGVWSEWESAAACSFIPSLNRYARLETRTCTGVVTRLDGAFCQGERTRFVDCAGPLDGNKLVVLVSNGLSANVQAKVNEYANVVRAKGADVAVVPSDSNQSIASLRSLIDSYVLPSGSKPNSVLLVGAFKHAQVNGKNASGVIGKIYSDLPYEVALDRFQQQADGSFNLNPSFAGQPVSMQRAVFWIDFSNHVTLNAQYPNVESKYVGVLNKIIQKQQNASYGVSENRKAKFNLFVDGYWDNQPYHISNNKAQTVAYIGTSRSGRGGLVELMNTPADMAAVMSHSNGLMLSLASRTYLPSNDSLNATINAVGADSLLTGVPVRSKHLNLYACYSGDPSKENVMNSALLNTAGDVVSVVASTTSGALDNWTGYIYYDKLALGHSAAQSFLLWSRVNDFKDNGVVGKVKNPYENLSTQSFGSSWFYGLIKSGDPLYRN